MRRAAEEQKYSVTEACRALRICRSLGVRSTIKYARHSCTRLTSDPQCLADVTEFKYYVGPSVHKLYLSAILDLCDRRIVSFVLRDANDSSPGP